MCLFHNMCYGKCVLFHVSCQIGGVGVACWLMFAMKHWWCLSLSIHTVHRYRDWYIPIKIRCVFHNAYSLELQKKNETVDSTIVKSMGMQKELSCRPPFKSLFPFYPFYYYLFPECIRIFDRRKDRLDKNLEIWFYRKIAHDKCDWQQVRVSGHQFQWRVTTVFSFIGNEYVWMLIWEIAEYSRFC